MYEYKIDSDHIFYTEDPLTIDELELLKEHKALILNLFKSKPGTIRINLKPEGDNR